MHIGIDASRANRVQKTGVEWYAFHLLKHFYDLDNVNEYSLYTDTPLATDLRPSSPNFKEKRLRWPISRFWTLGRMSLQMLFKKPDVLFVPSHTFPFVAGVKNVITWHDVGYEKYPETYTAWDLASLKQGAKRAFKIADKILTVSNFTKNEIVRIYGVEPDRIKVIYPGCNHQLWRPATQEQIAKIKAKHRLNHPYFLFLSRISLRKNPVGMIRFYNNFRHQTDQPYLLLMIGREEGLQEEIDAEIAASLYKNDIIKMGWQPPADLPTLISGARAMLVPSIYEGFGLISIEGMACGCPIIASDSGALPEVIGGAGLLAPAHDIGLFTKHLLNICHNEQLRQDLIEKGFKRSREFDWESCAQETLREISTA